MVHGLCALTVDLLVVHSPEAGAPWAGNGRVALLKILIANESADAFGPWDTRLPLQGLERWTGEPGTGCI